MKVSYAKRLYAFLAPRAYSVIIFGALFCTLAVKLFQSLRLGRLSEYSGWILSDIAVLLGIDIVLSVVCFFRPRRWVIRSATILAAVVCTWSVMNAGWIIRTGTQILPPVLLPLFRDPVNSLGIIFGNLAEMPFTAIILLGPSAAALGFFFVVLAKPVPPAYTRKQLDRRVLIWLCLIFAAVSGRLAAAEHGSASIGSAELRYNCQLRAVTSLILPGPARLSRAEVAEAKRIIPTFDKVTLELSRPRQKSPNVLLVVLEGVQYKYTSLADEKNNLTPHLALVARRGIRFANARSTVTHTTKALFSILTGRYPSVSQELVEAVVVDKPYASIATILKKQLGYRSAFFQSAKGNFESRPALVHNLGFEKFWAREDANKPASFVGSLGCDEFEMLEPISKWISSSDKPFLITIMCSVTHDPYEVPKWYAEPAKEPLERYKQTIRYTDQFLEALDKKLAALGLADKTIFCIVGDHGEGFGEHGLMAHERIAFEEALRIPWVVRVPGAGPLRGKITEAVSSIDVTPTLLSLLGFSIKEGDFDGANGLGNITASRPVYFSGWLQESPSGFVRAGSEGTIRKFIYYPSSGAVVAYDLADDPMELNGSELSREQAKKLSSQIIRWRKGSIFQIYQKNEGERVLFGHWFCRWKGRSPKKCSKLNEKQGRP